MSKNFMNWDGSDSSQQTYLQTEILRELRGQGVPPGGYPPGAAAKGAGQFVVWFLAIFVLMWQADKLLRFLGAGDPPKPEAAKEVEWPADLKPTHDYWETADEQQFWSAIFVRIDENSSLVKDGVVVKGDVLVLKRSKDERWPIFKKFGEKWVEGEIIRVLLTDMSSLDQWFARKSQAYLKAHKQTTPECHL